MKKFIVSIFALMISLATFANEEEVTFTADRPGASTGTAIVGRHVVLWEQGIQYDGGEKQFSFSNTLFRFGIFDGVELRLGGNAFLYKGQNNNTKAAFSGLNIGTKISCYEGKGGIPAISFMANFDIPKTGTNGFSVTNLAPSLYLLFDNPLGDKFNLTYNIGAEWDGEVPTPNAFLALCLGCNFTENFGGFVESFNQLGKSNMFGANLGISYMVAPKVQLDASANFDVCNPIQSWGVELGVAWQINK